ncbi:hypothetical protein ACTHOQ_01105 [Solibacillus silvestris]|uniref:hypothetical protein n=1 Tax=Solibacillus silvestris TaxID=76853 RepID=UPI003F7D9851
MLQKQPQHMITIQMLTKTANINRVRVTFYNHFQNLAQFHGQFIMHYILELYGFMKPLNYKT